MSEQSEFGKGFLLCLVKFAGHFMYDMYSGESKEQKNKSLEIWGGEKRLESSRVETWANGASDHLYEIEAPAGKEWDGIRYLVKELKDYGLKVGHGFTGNIWTKEDMGRLMDLTYEIAIETDKILGVKSEIGKW
jgi:hypothetical protein